ncbi:MAG: RCC1 domain-containing protein [bacterium]
MTDACKPDPPCVADVTGYGPTCWRLRDGAVRCAGDNTRDLLGLEAGDHHHPRPTPWARYPRVDDLHVGHGFGCALLPGGAVECWGSRLYGRLGDGSTEGSRVEGAPVVGLPPVVELVGGFDFTCGRTAEGAVWCWGGDIEGEQGNGDGSDDGSSDDGSGDAPTAHRLALRPARALAAGARHACAIADDETVWCWGAHHAAYTPDPMERAMTAPTRVGDLTAPGARLAMQLWGACLVGPRGEARCWGRHRGPAADEIDPPTAPLTVYPGVREIVIANEHTCVVTADGARVRCAGDDRDGRLGGEPSEAAEEAEDAEVRWVDVALPFTEPVVRLHGQPDGTCAISLRGDVACWGDNHRGQLGVGADPEAEETRSDDADAVVPLPRRPDW